MNKIKQILIIDSTELLQEISGKLDNIISNQENRKKVSSVYSGDFLNNSDVQRILGVSSSTLQSYRTKGKIGFIKKGRKIYYTKDHLTDFLADSDELPDNNNSH